MDKQLEEFQKLNVGDVISVKGQEFTVTGEPYCDTHFASWKNNGWKVNTTGGEISYYDGISIVGRSMDMQLRRGNLEDFQTLKAGHIISAESVGERLLVLGEPILADFQGLIVLTDGGAVSVNDNIRVIGYVKPEAKYHLNAKMLFERLPESVQSIYRDYLIQQDKLKSNRYFEDESHGFHDVVEGINFMCSRNEEKYGKSPFEEKVYTGKYTSDLYGKVDVTVMMPSGYIELLGDIEALPEDSEARMVYDELDTESILSCDGIHTDFYIDDPDVQNYMIYECRKLVSGFVDDYYASCFETKETNREEEEYER